MSSIVPVIFSFGKRIRSPILKVSDDKRSAPARMFFKVFCNRNPITATIKAELVNRVEVNSSSNPYCLANASKAKIIMMTRAARRNN